jgi:pyridoxamine 5'-phosphate oxidase
VSNIESIAALRKEYTLAELSEKDVDASPIVQFNQWFGEALNAGLAEPNAMTVATVDASGRPSARIVLIKGVDARGFVFYTNYLSKKGHDLAAHPQAALLFYWAELERQVRIEGTIEKVSEQESDAYYLSRPLGSRLGAWASPQSQEVQGRGELEELLGQVQAKHGDDPQRPPHWGGYRLVPDYFEFWQGRASRLHDRIAYRRQANGGEGEWVRSRLAP